MALTETRTYRLQGRRFTRPDLQSLIKIFSEVANELEQTLAKKAMLAFQLSTADDTTYESEDGQHFEEGEAVDLKRITSISFTLLTYSPRYAINLELSHGDSKYSNKLRVSSEDSGWVHQTFSRLKERIESVEPSESWFTRHPRLFFHISAIAIGLLIQGAIDLAINLFLTEFPGINAALDAALRSNPPEWLVTLAMGLPHLTFLAPVWWWLLGASLAASLRSWALAAWPSIDLDLGPASTRHASNRRVRIGVVIALWIVPILCMVGYDVLKFAFVALK